ncbi:transmembrane alpha-helix domain-containing protein [Colletotrichum graminicola]|uniref:Transmembrane alpha-helix domain-containing protein n=1 Tax=Colletotrichum graminicola (strain M1.001 / M2 / FGSC 10212) TaxID=645133 RepID=E3QXL2_COLGM|nr:transmembrane alpha-helix domain-containing protein [Colletotrichum graminicola M1.001]EFQ35600.1 transmembrane alpha-helix domain-containing protein [Colletotrichum graminicola M1.001]WDK12810.1 transmembrane alpha-helix domain-containing protein [Colletotrichum graminicola]
MSAVKLDSNAWYAISEGRVANVSDPLTTNLQDTDSGLRVFSKTDAMWQFQPTGDKDGRYLVRLNSAGVGKQLSVCWTSEEVHPSRTRGCLRRTESDESQQWDITEWENEKGTLKFTNVANGTGYVLDVHPGSNLFMSSEIEGTNGVSARQPAQHWIMTSSKAVDDGAYSTIYSAGTTPVSSASPTATATGTNGGAVTPTATDGSATPSSSPGPSSSAELSSGAAAGIGVGVSLGVIAILGAAFFFWWRRRKASRNTSGPQNDYRYELGHDGGTVEKMSPGTMNASTISSSTPESKVLGHMQSHAHAAEANANPIYEAPNDTRYELDSGMSAPTHTHAQNELHVSNARQYT